MSRYALFDPVPSLAERARRAPCPVHGFSCALAGNRGLVFTWLCGFVRTAADNLRGAN